MLFQLQYLRAIAALLVVYFHAVLQFQKVDAGFDPQRFTLGETGVDVFFVLSGFVMWLTTAGRSITPVEFYRRRIKRIVPLYWLATLFSAAIAFGAPQLLRSTQFDIPHLLASLVFLPWRNPADMTMIVPVVVPGWTLNYEMFFYLVFALLLPLPERWRIPALGAAFVAILALCHILPTTTATIFYGEPIILEFLAGVVLGWLYKEKLLLPRNFAWLALVVGAVFLLVNEKLTGTGSRFYAWGIPAIFIVYGAVSIDLSKRRVIGWLSYLGDCSYAIYITHAFALAFLRIVSSHLSIGLLHNPVSFVILCLLLSSLVGAAVHEITTPRKKAIAAT